MNPLVEARRRAASTHGDRPALHHGDTTWTWEALSHEIDGLAGALATRNVSAGDRVALLADRSAAAVIGVHAVLATGATVVPLDPSHPPARLLQVIEDAQPSVLLIDPRTTRKHARTLREVTVPVVPLSERSIFFSSTPQSGDAPALILYTSGSTGRPKGVVLSADAVHAFASWAVDTLDFESTDRVAHLSPLSFDLSTLELFGPPLVGAATEVILPVATMFPSALVTALGPCSIVYTVPSVWQRLLSVDLAALAHGPLRQLVYAGEPFAPAPLAQLMAALPDRPVHNFFGPTETNVCCAHRITTPPTAPVPIGTAASSALLSIKPEADDPSVGELLVCGPSVMSAYWNRPEQTTDRFEHGPDGQRWLRTGDRVRRDSSGLLHALGRRDTMLKHRGFRIQPEEIEATLVQHDAVFEARVGLSSSGELTAEVALFSDLPTRELTRQVAHQLPPYMVPTQVVRVGSLPRTARGKLDRIAPAVPLRTETESR